MTYTGLGEKYKEEGAAEKSCYGLMAKPCFPSPGHCALVTVERR